MPKLTPKQRAYLTSLAAKIKPFMQIGKKGLTEKSIEHIKDALSANELIKIKILDTDTFSREEIAKKIKENTNAEIVRIIGKNIILYRPKKEPEIKLP